MKELFLSFKYSFSSGTGELEGERYFQTVHNRKISGVLYE